MTRRVTERLRFEPDRTVTVLSGKVELGQGLSDALTLICSEELALAPDRIRVRYGDTGATPDDGLTAGSGSMERAGAAVRDASRAARHQLIRRAAKRLEVPEHRLEARSGAIRPRAERAGGEPAPEHGERAGVEQGPAPGTGGSVPETGPAPVCAAVDYWDLFSAEELGGGQVDASCPPPAAGVRAVPSDREHPAPFTTGSTRSAAARRTRTPARSHSPPGTPPAPGTSPAPGTPGADPSSRGPRSEASPNRSPAAVHAPDAGSDGQRTPEALRGRPASTGREGSWRRVHRVVRGGGNFVHDLRLPGMVHGRVLRPPGYRQRLTGLAADAARAMRGVLAVVVDGRFVAVAAEREEQAAAAHDVLAASASWQRQPDASLPTDRHAAPRNASAQSIPVRQSGAQPPGLPDGRATSRLDPLAAATPPAARGGTRRRAESGRNAGPAPPGHPAERRAALREAPAETNPGLQRRSLSPRLPAGGPPTPRDTPPAATPPAARRKTRRRTESGRNARPAPPDLPSDGRAALREAPAESALILRRGAPPDAHAATVSATYSRPFLMHAALGPSAAAARLDRDGSLTVWSHTQGPFELRAALAEALQRPAESIRVIHVDGSGCYGHNGADDVALDAALLALAVPGRPVRVKWTREDEHRWEPFGTAMIVTCSAQLDTAGTILSWRHEVRSHAHGTRPRGTPGHSTLLAAWHRAAPLTPPEPRNGSGLTAGPQRNAEPLYDFAAVDLTTHFVPDAPVRVSALRSLGAFANVFAIESFMDELAARHGEDPLAYRLRHLRDERARRVLTEAVRAAPALPARAPRAAHSPAPAATAGAAAECAVDTPVPTGDELSPTAADAATDTSAEPARAPARAPAEKPAAPPAQTPANATEAAARGASGNELVGRGMAVARYKNLQACVAVVCDAAVDPGSGRIRLLHATIAADAGRIIDRDGLANQLEGGFLQAASWTLKEAVRWDAAAIRSTDWDTYPVLRFSEVPPVTVHLIDRPDQPSVGAGEASQGPTPAAITNAVYAAAGIRLRHTPFTPARVMAALGSAGERAATATADTR